ncbi:Intracellular distribution of mitochondria [Glutinoglossum americanum]|uniref:Clustered mitochondria protein homolog n=1 Tax=Glutinoglossum americanum TaxID=1670608 RepID=A0A9P8KZT8_9PEZI|nr:Intracellular distribution of mitochondria [Glutinoglossum americanum]
MVDEAAAAVKSGSDEPKDEIGNDQATDSVFPLTVNLPHEPYNIQIMVTPTLHMLFRGQYLIATQVSNQEQMQDVRQSIVEFPGTFQYTCFHLEHKGQRINDYIELSEINGLTSGSEMTLVEDPYTEKEARLHMVRMRELIGATGDRTDTLHGISAGLSLNDTVAEYQHRNSPASADGQAIVGETATPHAMSNYDFEAPGSFSTLLLPTQAPPPKTIKSISLSPWNPPPHHLRQRGHLIYLQVTTNEGEQHHITSHVTGFYVNKSANSKFDPFPKPSPKNHAAHSLLSLISSLSPSFASSFAQLQEHNNQKDPLATFQLTNTIPSNPWLVAPSTSPFHAHQSDIARTQESYLMSGQEHVELLRDWNEEFQSTRELPRETVQERLFRERLISRLFADYNECAARGALLVARGEVVPLNPTEGRDAQIFLYNNVFFSYGADGVGTFAAEGGDEAARVATGKDVKGVKAVNDLDIQGLFTPGTVVVDYLGKRLVGQSIVPGIFKQRDPGENQIDYGGVEGKDVVAEHEDFIPVFEKLSKSARVKKHPVWDKEGKRHDLEGSVETKGLLGTDGRKYVLDLYRITPLDIAWLEEHWIERTDGAEAASGGRDNVPYPHRMAVLRPELVESFWKTKLRVWVNAELDRRRQARKTRGETEARETITNGSAREDTTAEVEADGMDAKAAASQVPERSELEQEQIDVSDFHFALNPDVFCGQVPQTDEEKAEWAQDEKDVRAACGHLRSTVIPEIIHDLNEGDVGFPMDGQSLSRLMHKRGVNIRYLGKIANLAEARGRRVESVKIIATQEMISRGFKHVANRYLRYLPAPFATECIAHLLNCLLGTGLNAHPTVEIDDTLRSMYPEADVGFEKVTPETLKRDIEFQVKQRYRYELETDWISKIKHTQLLREIALKLGLQLEAKIYHFSDKPITPADAEGNASNGIAKNVVVNGHSTAGKKKKRSGSPTSSIASGPSKSPTTFTAEDIVNVVPVVKDATPRSALADEALEGGRISIMQNQREIGQELLLESLSFHEQIYGILHPEVARVYNQLSLLYYQLEEKNAAVELARKAVTVSERTIGIDSAETVLNYVNLGLFEHANGNTKPALAYIKHALELWKIVYGPGHPDSITTINNAAVMLQHIKEFHESRMWFEASLVVCEKTYGRQSIHTATLLFQLAQALALDNDSKGAVNRMRECYNIFLNELGAKDRNTKEAETWLEQLTQNAVSIAKHAKDVQARRLRRVNLTPHVTLAMRPQPQVGQSSADVANGANGGDPRSSIGLDSRSIDELMKFIEGDASKTTPKKRPGRSNPKRRGGGSVGGS